MGSKIVGLAFVFLGSFLMTSMVLHGAQAWSNGNHAVALFDWLFSLVNLYTIRIGYKIAIL